MTNIPIMKTLLQTTNRMIRAEQDKDSGHRKKHEDLQTVFVE